MGGKKGIVSTLVAAVALCSLAGSVNAGTGGAASPSLRWHSPSRIDVVRERLKRSDAAPSLPAPQTTRWRRPGQGSDVGVRRNRWRATAIRPRRSARTQTATATRGYDEALVAAINEVRARHGLVALRRSDRLEAAAELHSRNMGRRGVFEHESAGGTPFWKRVEQFYASRGFGYWAVGENLIWGSPELSIDQAIQGWMNSPAHRANMLSREWREVGLASVRLESAPGVYGGRAVTIVTCDFGVRR
ncbi:MAG: CAP domain-containing protein [Thermoleophilia bacterium]|nr:CAP domain-containing protein [Thermoleophilia bacterium]